MTKNAAKLRTYDDRLGTPAVAIHVDDHRVLASMTYRLAARLELTAPNQWCVVPNPRSGVVHIESSIDDEPARRAALALACEQEFGK